MGTVEAKGRRIYPEKPSYFFPYGVCWKMGLKIKLNIDPPVSGTIISVNHQGNLNVRYEGNQHTENTHPAKLISYYNKKGKLLKEFK